MRGFARGRYVASARLKHPALNTPPAMDAANLVDIRLTCAYETGHGLHTSTYPVAIVPACAVCYGPAFCPPCATCGYAYCETCYGQHIRLCCWCGAPGDAPCECCGCALCSSRAPEHNCEAPEKPDSETPEEPEGELDPDTGGTGRMPREKSSVYDDLRFSGRRVVHRWGALEICGWIWYAVRNFAARGRRAMAPGARLDRK